MWNATTILLAIACGLLAYLCHMAEKIHGEIKELVKATSRMAGHAEMLEQIRDHVGHIWHLKHKEQNPDDWRPF